MQSLSHHLKLRWGKITIFLIIRFLYSIFFEYSLWQICKGIKKQEVCKTSCKRSLLIWLDDAGHVDADIWDQLLQILVEETDTALCGAGADGFREAGAVNADAGRPGHL